MRVKEFRDLAISALVLALAFGIALSGGFRAFQQPAILVWPPFLWALSFTSWGIGLLPEGSAISLSMPCGPWD